MLKADPNYRTKIYVYDMPAKYNKKRIEAEPTCLTNMFASEVIFHANILDSLDRTLNPDEADWFYVPAYSTCDLLPNGTPYPDHSPHMMRSAIYYISTRWPYWNITEGADHFFIVPHDHGSCFHYQVPFSFCFLKSNPFSITSLFRRYFNAEVSSLFFPISFQSCNSIVLYAINDLIPLLSPLALVLVSGTSLKLTQFYSPLNPTLPVKKIIFLIPCSTSLGLLKINGFWEILKIF